MVVFVLKRVNVFVDFLVQELTLTSSASVLFKELLL